MRVRHDGNELFVASPAKLNLYLELTGKRDDGYHDIETVMTTVSLYDELVFRCHSGTDFKLTVDLHRQSPNNAASIPIDDRNLVVRALKLLREEASRESVNGELSGMSISLFKRIPAEAGLGGASSNAAAALIAGSQLWGLNWSRERLVDLAARIGSDVPYFLTGGWALCVGRGEVVTSIPTATKVHVVIVKPQDSFSTAGMFGKVKLESPTRRFEPLVAELESTGERWGKTMFNRFSDVAIETSRQVDQVARQFARLPTWGHQLSGSGSSYFGVFASARLARRAAAILRSRCPGMQIFAVASCNGVDSITSLDNAA